MENLIKDMHIDYFAFKSSSKNKDRRMAYSVNQ